MHVPHLKELPAIQCEGCLLQMVWDVEGDAGKYRMFVTESHAPGCPYEFRNGRRVYHDEMELGHA
jgi:hypothetical protein